MAEDRLEKLVRRYQKAAEKKDSWGEHWRECYEYAFPQRENVSCEGFCENSGAKKNLHLYDGTAPDAVDQLASSLLAELTPAWAKWFGLRAGSELNETERAQVAPVLEKTTDVMLQNFEHSNFAVEIHQCYLDLVTAGTACLMFEEAPLGLQHMDVVIDAMRTGHVLRLEYQAYTWEHSKEVVLEPYFLKLFRHRWYLIGINRSYDAFRSYSLDRIKSLSVGEENFRFPRKFTPQDYFRDCFGIIQDETLPPQRTVLRVAAGQVPYLRNLPLHSSQKEITTTEEYTDFELYISHTYDFIQELFSKGATIEVLEPQSLRDVMRSEIKKMQKLYGL